MKRSSQTEKRFSALQTALKRDRPPRKIVRITVFAPRRFLLH